MKIIVSEFKKISPYESLYVALSEDAKTVLRELGKQYFSNRDLYILLKLGCDITYIKDKEIS